MKISESGNPPGSHVVLNGVRIDGDELVNPTLLTDASIARLHDSFMRALPFKHVVVDGLFSSRLLECIESEFDGVKSGDWERYDNRNERKLGSKPRAHLGRATQLYFDMVYSGRLVDFVARVSGIDGLLTDPMLYGGGLHRIPSGGRFAIHIDFNKHPVTRLDNRLVFITYLNKDWKPDHGGALELWDIGENRCAAKVTPVLGRSVLLCQSRNSAHGHPDPVRAPAGRERRSLAAYFYSNGTDEPAEPDHTTVIIKPITVGPYARVALAVKYMIPPVFVDAFRFFSRRRRR